MKILFIGDVFGKPGRKAVRKALPELRERHHPDFIILNGENAAHGTGITEKSARELFSFGVDVITGGNHSFDKKQFWNQFDDFPFLLRPANFPPGVRGKGHVIVGKNDMKLGVVNLQGRIELPPLDSPFVVGKQLVEAMQKETSCIMVDFHAEATSEKRAFGFFMDGLVSAVVGTHTHVPTADETILPRGTAYITDVGMAGVEESVIGVKKELAIKRFLTLLPLTFEVAEGSVILDFVVIDIASNGKAKSISRGRWRE